MDKKFLKLYDEYKDRITDSDIKREFDMLYSIAQDSNVCLVTVVGNVNAGKSTVFNCLVHKEISQTDSGENTVRPTFVFTSKKDIYNTYSSEDNQPIDINKVLQYFFEPDEKNISDCLTVQKLSFEDTKKNQNGDFLFTSYGFDLNIKEASENRIVFVDMPGNDGLKAKRKDHSFYKLILKRSDLVILVCSSQEDISITMKEYIEEIRDYNSVVPFVIALNDKNSKNDFEGDGDDCNKKLIENITRLRESQVNIDEKQSSIINAYHVSAKILEHKTPKEGSLDKVNKSCDDFETFEKNIAESYFSKSVIKSFLKKNQDKRFANQKVNFRKLLENTISSINNDIIQIEKEIKSIIPIEDEKEVGSKQHITDYLNKKITPDVLDSDPNMKCAENYTNDTMFLKKYFVSILKDEYWQQHLSKELSEEIYSNYITDYFNKLREKIKGSRWKDCVLNNPPKSEFTIPELDDKLFKKCFEFRLWKYDRTSLEEAMKELKRRMLTYGYMGDKSIGVQLFNACAIIKNSYFNEIGAHEKLSDKKQLKEIMVQLHKLL